MLKGKVKFYAELKGFGFIVGEDGKQLFFHIKDCVDIYADPSQEGGRRFGALRSKGRVPQVGDALCYDETHEEKGWRAETWGFADTILSIPNHSRRRTPTDESPDAWAERFHH